MKTISEELEEIRSNHGGILFPKDVVDFARDRETALHGRFDWDDSTAAESYRLWQARQVIRVCVTIINRDDRAINTYVSLAQDRHATDKDGFSGGYRNMIEVLSVPALRRTLLEDALQEHDQWEQKYRDIVELAEIFAAARTIKQKQELISPKKATA